MAPRSTSCTASRADPRLASPFVVYERVEASAAAVEPEPRTLAEDLRLATAWMNEVKADLVAAPEDLELLAEEELLAVLLERLERARLYGDS